MSILQRSFVIVSVVLLIIFNGPNKVGCTGNQDDATTALIETVKKGDIENDMKNYKTECIDGMKSFCLGFESECESIEGFAKVIIKHMVYEQTENLHAKAFLKFKDDLFEMNKNKPEFSEKTEVEQLTEYLTNNIQGDKKADTSLIDSKDAKSYVAEMYCQTQMCTYELNSVINCKIIMGSYKTLQQKINCLFLNITISEVEFPLAKYYFTYLHMAIDTSKKNVNAQVGSDRKIKHKTRELLLPEAFCNDIYALAENALCIKELIEEAKLGDTIDEVVKNIYFHWSLAKLNPGKDFQSKGKFLKEYMKDLTGAYDISIEKLEYGYTVDEFCKKNRLI